jgi:Na+-driven multidrug efflux pump
MISDGFNFSGETSVLSVFLSARVHVHTAFSVAPLRAGGSVLRGASKNSLQAGIVLGCSYGISLPVGIFLCLGSPQWGLRGLWAGMSVGLTVSSLLEWGYALLLVDWKKESQVAQARAAEEQAKNKADSVHSRQSLYD